MAKSQKPMVGALGLLLLLGGCASGAPADPGQIAKETERLLRPYLTGTEVGCNELLIELTGNFNEYVFQPATDPQAHTLRHEGAPDGTYIDKIWTNTLGRAETPFIVSVGQPPDITEPGQPRGMRTTFTVINQVRLRIYQGTHALTLDTKASGERNVFVRLRGTREVREPREFVIEDGQLTRS